MQRVGSSWQGQGCIQGCACWCAPAAQASGHWDAQRGAVGSPVLSFWERPKKLACPGGSAPNSTALPPSTKLNTACNKILVPFWQRYHDNEEIQIFVKAINLMGAAGHRVTHHIPFCWPYFKEAHAKTQITTEGESKLFIQRESFWSTRQNQV